MNAATPAEALIRALGEGNPFSDQVARLDGTGSADVPTLHGAVRTALHSAIEDVATRRSAVMVLVPGEPGQGKTHELSRLREAAHGRYHFLDIPPLKDAGAPFQHLLRYAVHSLQVRRPSERHTELERLLWHALSDVAAAVRVEAARDGEHELEEQLSEVLAGNHRFVGVFAELLCRDLALAERVVRRGRALPPLDGLHPDFGRVLGRLPDPDARPAVLDWLRGAELADEDLRMLDVRTAVDSEARCFEVLRALVRIAHRPPVFCLDQLESTQGLLGREGNEALFTALMELYQQLPVCIVLMCQTQVWADLREKIPAAARDRIRELPPLASPDIDGMAALVAARLEPAWRAAGATPPYPSYPFSLDYLRAYRQLIGRRSVRHFLSHCEGALAAMLAAGAVAEPPALAPSPSQPQPAAPPVNQILAGELRDALRKVTEQPDLHTPALRQERVRHAVADLLNASALHSSKIGAHTVVEVTATPKPRSGPRLPLVVTVDSPGRERRRVAVEIHSDDPRGAWRALQRLHDRIEHREADAGVLLRESGAPIGQSAPKTLELARALEPQGGISYLETEAAHRLVAAELLLDAVSASEVWAGDHVIGRDEALGYLLEHESLGGVLAPALSRVSLPAASITAVPSGSTLAARILTFMESSGVVAAVDRIAQELSVSLAELEPVLGLLQEGGKVSVLLDRRGVRIVLLRRGMHA